MISPNSGAADTGSVIVLCTLVVAWVSASHISSLVLVDLTHLLKNLYLALVASGVQLLFWNLSSGWLMRILSGIRRNRLFTGLG